MRIASDAGLKALLPTGCAWAWEDPKAPATGLHPLEAASMARAVPKRIAEFAAGRRAARAALAELGIAPGPIPMGDDRAPIWPQGIVGSISHCDTACLAVVARQQDVHSIGIDMEPDEPLPDDLLDIICTKREREWLAQQESTERGHLARLIFSAKEATYKAQYPVTGLVLEFDDVALNLDLSARRFTANVKATAPYRGAFRHADGLILTCVATYR